MRMRNLVQRTGFAERQVRYLIAEGFIPPPRGGRANAEYGDDHVQAIIRYAKLRDLGFPPAAIRLLMEATAGIPFPISKGVTLVVDTSLLASNADVEPIAARAREILSDIFSSRESKGLPGGSDD